MDFTLCLSDAGINASWVGIFRLSTMNWSHRLPHVNAQPSSLNCEVPYVCLQVQLEYLIFQIEFAELKIQSSTNYLCKLYSKRKKKNLIVLSWEVFHCRLTLLQEGRQLYLGAGGLIMSVCWPHKKGEALKNTFFFFVTIAQLWEV